jgi:hypothetical protein
MRHLVALGFLCQLTWYGACRASGPVWAVCCFAGAVVWLFCLCALVKRSLYSLLVLDVDDYRWQVCRASLANGREVVWGVGGLLDMARALGVRPTRWPVSRLALQLAEADADEPIGSPAFCARAGRTDLDAPLIVVVAGGDDDCPEFIVADGLHRIWKALHDPLAPDTLPVLLLPLDELPDEL